MLVRQSYAAFVIVALLQALMVFCAYGEHVITLRDGGSITGELIEEESTDDYYVILDANGKYTVDRSRVLRIVELKPYQESLDEATKLLDDGQLIEAALKYWEAHESTSEAEVRESCRQSIHQIAEQLIMRFNQGQAENLPPDSCRRIARMTGNLDLISRMDEAIRIYLETDSGKLLEAGRKASDLNEFDKAISILGRIIQRDGANPSTVQEAREELARIYVRLAQPLYRQGGTKAQKQAEELLIKALNYDSGNDRARFMLGYTLVGSDRELLGVQQLLKVKDRSSLNSEEIAFLDRYVEPPQPVAKQEIPPTRPPAIDATADRLPEEETEEVSSEPEVTPVPFFNRTFEKGRDFYSNWIAPYTGIILKSLAALVIAFLLLYLFPYLIVRQLSWRRTDLRRDYTEIARYWGMIALVMYVFRRRERKKKPEVQKQQKKKKGKGTACSYCHNAIGSPTLFANLNFDKCPHCGNIITPLYSARDYIIALGEEIPLSHRGEKRRGRRPVGAAELKGYLTKLLRGLVAFANDHGAEEIQLRLEGPPVMGCYFFKENRAIETIELPERLYDPLLRFARQQVHYKPGAEEGEQEAELILDIRESQIPVRIRLVPGLEKIVFDLRSSGKNAPDLESLNLPQQTVETIRRYLSAPEGLILFGLSDSNNHESKPLPALLTELVNLSGEVVVLSEDSKIEFEGVRVVSPEEIRQTLDTSVVPITGKTSPLVIERADREIMSSLVARQIKERLVVTLLQADSAMETLAIAGQMGLERDLLSRRLISAIALREVRLLCPLCKASYRPREDEMKQMNIGQGKIGPDTLFYYGRGCAQCKNTGYQDSTWLAEIISFGPTDSGLRKAIESNLPIARLWEMAQQQQQSQTFWDEAVVLLTEGKTGTAELIRLFRPGKNRLLSPSSGV